MQKRGKYVSFLVRHIRKRGKYVFSARKRRGGNTRILFNSIQKRGKDAENTRKTHRGMLSARKKRGKYVLRRGKDAETRKSHFFLHSK
jgi:hypothetical protein